MFQINRCFKPYVRMTRGGKWVRPEAMAYLASQAALKTEMRTQMSRRGWEKIPKGSPLSIAIAITDFYGKRTSYQPSPQREQTESSSMSPIQAKSKPSGKPDAPGPSEPTAGNWTDQQLALLRQNYNRFPYKDLAQLLGKTEHSIRNKAWRLGLRKRSEFWTESELATLRGHYLAQDPPNLATLELMFPGRNRTNICRKARELGLTQNGRLLSNSTRIKISDGITKWHKENEHPRGYSGHTHSAEAKAIISESSKKMWADPNSIVNSEEYRNQLSDRAIKAGLSTSRGNHPYSRGKMGKRADLNDLFLRSSWEANYARYLNWLMGIGEIARWEYEPDTFWFEGIKRGTRSYTPDFKVWSIDGTYEYHEVKGWMDQKSQTKLRRMQRYHPNERVIVIDSECYKQLARDVSGFIAGWE